MDEIRLNKAAFSKMLEDYKHEGLEEGFYKAVAALRKIELTDKRTSYLLENATYSDWLLQNKEDILEQTDL